MNLDDIEALISKHGSITAQSLKDLVVTVVLEAVEAEREACAKLCDEEATIEGVAQRCADAIRTRSNV
jgi:hypothetical protein